MQHLNQREFLSVLFQSFMGWDHGRKQPRQRAFPITIPNEKRSAIHLCPEQWTLYRNQYWYREYFQGFKA
jgi:hypothetical protein